MKVNWYVIIFNSILLFVAYLLRYSYDNATFNFSLLSIIFALLSALGTVGILFALGIFSGKKLPQVDERTKRIVLTVQLLQGALFVYVFIQIFLLEQLSSIISLPVMILLVFLPFALIFLIPGFVGWKSGVLYNGTLLIGGRIDEGKIAKQKGLMLLIMASVIFLAVLTLAYLSVIFNFQ